MTNEYTFCLALPHDKEGVIALLTARQLESFQEQGLKSSPVAFDLSSQMFDNILTDPHYFIVIGKDSANTVIASACVYLLPMIRRGNYIAYVEYIVVSQALRGQGIGTQLMRYLIEVCHSKNIDAIKLFSRTTSKQAHSFYSNLGFTQPNYGFTLELINKREQS